MIEKRDANVDAQADVGEEEHRRAEVVAADQSHHLGSPRRLGASWEGDTMLGASQAGPCVLSLVERKTGYLLLGQLRQRISAAVNARARQLITAQPHRVRTITVDNGTEFHDYAALERATRTRFYFATPHHAWERGTNENTNGLVRQYLPKRQSMAHLTQDDCHRIAMKLNRRPRKRLGYRTPEECYAG
ncbi:MAG: IS30 family transposase [Gemmatimonadales bacterium]